MNNELQLGSALSDPTLPDRAVIPVAIKKVKCIAKGLYANQLVNALGQPTPEYVGVVDPFLHSNRRGIKQGEYFWLWLLPSEQLKLMENGTWEHPAFPVEVEKEYGDDFEVVCKRVLKAKEWVREFAETIGQTYETLMAAADKYSDTGDYTYDNSESYKIPNANDKFEAFWVCYGVITGKSINHTDDGVFFTCSC